MPGKRKNYRPIWKRVRFAENARPELMPLKLWWRNTQRFAELVPIDESLLPRVHLPQGSRQSLWRFVGSPSVAA
jgi:hypothetical protein